MRLKQCSMKKIPKRKSVSSHFSRWELLSTYRKTFHVVQRQVRDVKCFVLLGPNVHGV